VRLPEVLAGPLLRRAEPGRVLVWLATSRPVRVHGWDRDCSYHDVSDDWNLTREWHDQAWRRPAARGQ
jgi:hypothetical protein